MKSLFFRSDDSAYPRGPLDSLGHLPLYVHVLVFGLFMVLLRLLVKFELVEGSLAMFVFYTGWFLVCVWLAARFTRYENIRQSFSGAPFRDVWDYTIAGIALKLLSTVLVLVQLAVLVKFSPGTTDSLFESFSSMVPPTQGVVQQILLLLSAGILAPVVEEYVFRGMILSRLLTKLTTPVAIIMTSTLFALMHPGFLYAFVLSLVLCVVARQTQSLFGPVAIHMIFNMSALVFSFGAKPAVEDAEGVPDLQSFDVSEVPWTSVLILGIGALAILWWFLRSRLPQLHVNENATQGRDTSLPL